MLKVDYQVYVPTVGTPSAKKTLIAQHVMPWYALFVINISVFTVQQRSLTVTVFLDMVRIMRTLPLMIDLSRWRMVGALDEDSRLWQILLQVCCLSLF